MADLVLIADADDPEIDGYRALVTEFDNGAPEGQTALGMVEVTQWTPMVHKLNAVAREAATGGTMFFPNAYFALAFAGDDHLPQTIGWARRYLDVLDEMQTGMVYGDDGYQGANLSTEWAVTADVVRALGRMVPADVEHMYCDNAMMDLFGGAGALRHLPEVRIEHMHPIAKKAASDAQYERVNHRDQFKKDKAGYEAWRGSGMITDIRTVRELRSGLPDVRPTRIAEASRTAGSMPRAVAPRPRGQKPVTKFGIPRHFKRVRGATPDEIGVTLADFAARVPADQVIVELGVFQGRTALLMAWGARQGNGAHVFGVDAWNLPGNTYGPPFNEVGSRTWAEYNVMALGFKSGITLIQDFAVQTANNWEHDKPVGLLFIDDDHSYDGARGAVLAWAPHLAPGAVIAVDDYGHPDWPGVAEAIDALVAEGVLAPLEIFHDRLAVTRLAPDPAPSSDADVSTPYVATESSVLQPTAITSEGVSPEPGLPVQNPDHPLHSMVAPVERESATGEPVEQGSMTTTGTVQEGEQGAARAPVGTPVTDLNLGQLRALARARKIVLGRRKDLKAEIVQALWDGR